MVADLFWTFHQCVMKTWLLLLIALVAPVGISNAATKLLASGQVWVNWSDPTSWQPNGVPTMNDHVILAGPVYIYNTRNGQATNAVVKSVEIIGGQVDLVSPFNLGVVGDSDSTTIDFFVPAGGKLALDGRLNTIPNSMPTVFVGVQGHSNTQIDGTLEVIREDGTVSFVPAGGAMATLKLTGNLNYKRKAQGVHQPSGAITRRSFFAAGSSINFDLVPGGRVTIPLGRYSPESTVSINLDGNVLGMDQLLRADNNRSSSSIGTLIYNNPSQTAPAYFRPDPGFYMKRLVLNNTNGQPFTIVDVERQNLNMAINGDVEVNPGAVFDPYYFQIHGLGGFPSGASRFNLAIKGNLTVRGVMKNTLNSIRGMRLTFNGISRQEISCTGDFEDFDLVIDNAADVLLQSCLRFNGTLTFQRGRLLSPSNCFRLASTGRILNASSTSFVEGSLTIEADGSNALSFPIGKSSFYRPVVVTPGQALPGEYTAEYFSASPLSVGVAISAPVAGITGAPEYWVVSKTDASAPARITFPLSGRVPNAAASGQLTICRWNGTVWESVGSTPSALATISTGQFTTNLLFSFSPFTFGWTGGPLLDQQLRTGLEARVYPSPATDFLFLQSDNISVDPVVEIHDPAGRLAKAGRWILIARQQQALYIGDLTAGAYYLSLISNQRRIRIAFIKVSR